MNADWFQITAIASIAATFLAIVGGVIVVAKFLIDLNAKVTSLETKLSDFKVEMRGELSEFKTEVRVELVKIQSRFDKYDGVNTDLEKRVAELKKQQADSRTQIAQNEAKIATLSAQSTATASQVADLKSQTAERFKQVETDNRDFIKELVQTVSR